MAIDRRTAAVTARPTTGRSVPTTGRSARATSPDHPTAIAPTTAGVHRTAAVRPPTTGPADPDDPHRGVAMPARPTRVAAQGLVRTAHSSRPRRCPRPTSSARTRSSSPDGDRSRRRSSPAARPVACSSCRSDARRSSARPPRDEPAHPDRRGRGRLADRAGRLRRPPGHRARRRAAPVRHASTTSSPEPSSAASRRSCSSSIRSRTPRTSARSCAARRPRASTACSSRPTARRR